MDLILQESLEMLATSLAMLPRKLCSCFREELNASKATSAVHVTKISDLRNRKWSTNTDLRGVSLEIRPIRGITEGIILISFTPHSRLT